MQKLFDKKEFADKQMKICLVVNVILQGFAKDQNIIKEDNNKYSKKTYEDIVHGGLKTWLGSSLTRKA